MSKFKIGDKVKLLASPADLNKSVGLVGVVTSNDSPVVNFNTGEIAETYGLMVSPGPNGQQCYGLAARAIDLEKVE